MLIFITHWGTLLLYIKLGHPRCAMIQEIIAEGSPTKIMKNYSSCWNIIRMGISHFYLWIEYEKIIC